MKKMMVITTILILTLFIVGCLDYKAYEIPKDEITNEKSEILLVKNLSDDNITNAKANQLITEVTSEVILPKLNSNKSNKTEVKKEIKKENYSETKNELKKIDVISENENPKIIKAKENQLVKLKVKIEDPDKDNISYSFTRPLSKEGTWKTNYGDAGEYMITLSATDGKLTTTQKIKLIIDRVNVAPVIETLTDINIKEGETIKFEPKINDPNKDPITITISEPLKNSPFTTNYDSAGEYIIKVRASDGELTSEKTFKLRIQDVNVKPEITNVKNLEFKEGDLVKIEPKIVDPDKNDKVTVKISEPVGDTGIWQTDYTDHGEYTITISANDGKDVVYKKINLNVKDINMPPKIIDVYLVNN